MHRRDMVWQSTELVRTFIDDVRGGVPYAADQIEMMLRVIAARNRPVKRFIDLGCGSGVLARAVLARHPDAEALLVDFSAPMLAEARAALSAQPVVPRFIEGDLADPAWSTALRVSAPFDLIVSSYAIHHLPHARKQSLYREVFELLGADGLFVNIEHVASSTVWVETVGDELMIDSVYAFHRQRGGTKTRAAVAGEYVHRADKVANILAPVEIQCDWLRQIGFDDVDCYFKVFELAVFGGRRPAA